MVQNLLSQYTTWEMDLPDEVYKHPTIAKLVDCIVELILIGDNKDGSMRSADDLRKIWPHTTGRK